MALLHRGHHVGIAGVQLDDDPLQHVWIRSVDHRGDVHLAVAYRHMGLALLQGAVLDVQQGRTVVHAGHFGRHVHGAEVGGPVGVHLELHLRTKLGDVVVAQPAVDWRELPPVVVQEQRDAVRAQGFHQAVDRLRSAFDRIEIPEIVGAEAARGAVQPQGAYRVHHLVDRRSVRPRMVAGRHREPQAFHLRLERLRRLAEQVERFNAPVADGGDALQHGVEVLGALLAQRIELNGDGFHALAPWSQGGANQGQAYSSSTRRIGA